MFASVGLEMACAWRDCCWIQTTEAARGIRTVWRVAVDGMTEAELLEARMTEEGSIADYGVERCAKLLKERRKLPIRSKAAANWCWWKGWYVVERAKGGSKVMF